MQSHFSQLPKTLNKHLKGRYRWFWLTLATFLTVISLWQAPKVNHDAAKIGEIHGVWMTNTGVILNYYTTRLDEVVANITKHNLNTIYPAVWNRGYTLHPSSVAPSRGSLSLGERHHRPFLILTDPLKGIVQQAHRQELRIIPWFEYGLMIPKNHAIAKQHPNWLSQTQQGKIHLPQGKFDQSENMAWLNPAHPEVQKFITNLIVDVVKGYAIDGIQLDDHFAIPVEFGYDNYTVQLYRQEHNGSPPPKNIKNPEWMAWRAKKLTQLMTKISQAVKVEKPQLIISLSPNSLDFAYKNYLQDWGRWVKSGLLDEVVVQIYRNDIQAIQNELNNQQLLNIRSRVPTAIGLYTGPFLSPKPIQNIKQEIAVVKKTKYQGVSFFSWETTLWIFKGGSQRQFEAGLREFLN